MSATKHNPATPYMRSFAIRWNDLDANRHVANTTYASLCSTTRIGFLNDNGWGWRDFAKHNIGPVIFSEDYHYLKEVHPNDTVRVDMEMLGYSDDYRFWKFAHSCFNSRGEQCMYSTVTFGWMDLATRKLIHPPENLSALVNFLPQAPNFKILTKEDTRAAQAGIPHKLLPPLAS